MLSFTFDNKELLQKNILKYGLIYRNIPVSNNLCHQLMGPNRGFSCIFIIDQNGKIALGHSGVGENDADVFAQLFIPKIESLLSEIKN